ncbi:MAG: nuclease-related domain-containing protein [Paludibacter sp.]|jgi:hypothetical protein
MCKIYNTIGSLKAIKLYLEENNIHEFKSLREVVNFQSSYSVYRQQLISHHKDLIKQEKNMLMVELKSLETAIEIRRQQTEQILTDEINSLKEQLNISKRNPSINFFQKLREFFKQRNYKRKIEHKEQKFKFTVNKSIFDLIEDYQAKSNRYQFITSKVDEAVKESASNSLSELERKKTVIDQLNSFIYGALGEQKVVKTLKKLSDEYFLINDFTVSFSPAIYNKQENDYIKSVQIDHILVAPSGVFLIETKNWSEKSLENLSLRSPVQQIRRTNFVLFMLLNNRIGDYHLHLDSHHWGEKKIPIRNLIVLTNIKPKEEFQYVKVLTLNELLGYINYFEPIFSLSETQRIADFILRVNE